jgi:hypothetical protein
LAAGGARQTALATRCTLGPSSCGTSSLLRWTPTPSASLWPSTMAPTRRRRRRRNECLLDHGLHQKIKENQNRCPYTARPDILRGTSQHHDTKREQCLHKSWLASQSKRQQRLRCLLLSSCIGKMSKTNHELGDLDFSFCSRYDWRGLTTTGMEVLIDRTMHTYLSG